MFPFQVLIHHISLFVSILSLLFTSNNFRTIQLITIFDSLGHNTFLIIIYIYERLFYIAVAMWQ